MPDKTINIMGRILGNLVWLLFGGLEAAIGYFTASIALACTIVGLPWALQTVKLGFLCLWPFGAQVSESNQLNGCLAAPLNIIWLIFGGLFSSLMHMLFGFLLCVSVIGVPWGKQHFKMASLSFYPFGKKVDLMF